jgi:hypothetical protein
MAKVVLDMGEMKESFFGDAVMLGIASPLPGYRLCWALNRHFDMTFASVPENTICMEEGRGGKEVVNFLGGGQADMFGAPVGAGPVSRWFFPTFSYAIANSSSSHILYQLRAGNKTLLPETKHLDFLWFIQTADSAHDAHTILLELRNLPMVQLAQEISREQIKKSITNLLL